MADEVRRLGDRLLPGVVGLLSSAADGVGDDVPPGMDGEASKREDALPAAPEVFKPQSVAASRVRNAERPEIAEMLFQEARGPVEAKRASVGQAESAGAEDAGGEAAEVGVQVQGGL